MNVIKLYGGLGNQMFQYAFGRTMEFNGIQVKYDLSWFYDHSRQVHPKKWDKFPRPYRLDKFNTNVKEGSILNQNSIKERRVDLNLLKIDGCTFQGYWSSFKYSEAILDVLRHDFTLKDTSYTEEFIRLKKIITSTNSVSLHVRRGDYIGRNGFQILPLKYYFEALLKVKGDLFIFSDDIPWCKQYFKEDYFSRKITFIDLEDYLSFELMKFCKHNIIANSTFSRWAAYLNNNPEKIVIAPSGWGLSDRDDKFTTIMIAYINRPQQLDKTLRSLLKYDPKDFNVIIIDDGSIDDIIPFKLPYEVKIIKLKDKTWINPVIAFNRGFIEALKSKPDYIIMQGVDCYHHGDLLSYVKNMDKNTYTSFGCYSLGAGDDPEKPVIFNNNPAKHNGERAWYNHPIYKPVGYNFCSAISTENLIKLNGFDERFKDGNAYEDNYFLHQIEKLGLKLVITSDPIVFHQYHPALNKPPNATNKNKILFEELSKGDDYKAKHILTPDLV